MILFRNQFETHPRGGEITHRQYWGEIVPGGLGARSDKRWYNNNVMSRHKLSYSSIRSSRNKALCCLLRSILPDSEGAGKFRSGFAQRRKNGS